MALLRLFDPTTQFQTKSGALNVAGKLRIYVESTDDLANIYGDDGSLLPQPLILDSNGRARGLFVDSGRSYRLESYDRNDSLLFTIRRLEPNASGTIVNPPTVFIKGTPDEIDVEDSVTEKIRTYTVALSAKVKGKIAENQEAIVKESEARKYADDELRKMIDDSSKVEAGTASPLMDGKASVGNSLKYAREDHVHPSDTSREDIANKTTVVLGTSDSKYPTDKAVAEFVNSSIATNTANYISNNGEPFTSVEQLEAYSGPVTNNDYAFVTGIDSEGNTYYDRYKATVSGSTVTWALEYRLNNSSFTAAQWSAINSGITSVLVAKIHDHGNKDVLDGITSSDVANWNSKQNSLTAGNNITIDGNTISSNQIFVATYGTTKYAEVLAAYNAGKLCMIFKDNRTYFIERVENNVIRFVSSNGVNRLSALTLNSPDSWSIDNSSLQSKLTFDSAPTAGSNNPVTSDGIKTALNGKAESSHTHGNIANGGTLQTNDITIANGDKLVVTDTSDSNKVARASLTFDGATTDQMLSKKGEWNDTIAKARAVVDYGSPSNAIEIGWGGASATSPTYFAVYTDSANGYNKAIKDYPLGKVRKLINGTSVGSAAVPVFINANGETQVCTDDFVHDGDVTSTYSSTGTAPVNGTAVAAAIGGLDVSSVGGDGKYISAISETDGKISAAATTMDTTPTANSTKAVTSGGIKTAIDNVQTNIDTVGAKGIVINEINGENVICFE